MDGFELRADGQSCQPRIVYNASLILAAAPGAGTWPLLRKLLSYARRRHYGRGPSSSPAMMHLAVVPGHWCGSVGTVRVYALTFSSSFSYPDGVARVRNAKLLANGSTRGPKPTCLAAF